MKTNSFSGNKSRNKESIISRILKIKTINKIARSCGFIKRKGGKILPKNLIVGFMIMVSKQRNTYADWATEIGKLENKTISKQSLNERMEPQTELFIKEVVQKVMSEKMQRSQSKKIKGVLKYFKQVKIDDSTTLHLPDELAEAFPGNVSRGEKKALTKIHAMYNLTQNDFPFFHLHNFSNNDQSLSADVLPYLQKGDLSIRDLGFAVQAVMAKFIDQGIYFISRKKYNHKVFDPETGAEINILKTVRKKKFIDQEVFIGKEKPLKVRMVVIPVPKPQAAQRKRKAHTNKDKRLNHSTEYYQLLDYNIYITNITPQQCHAEEIFELYKLRWRIEIIFKSWKSGFSLEKLIHRQCKNEIRVRCMIYLMLLYIYLFHVVWWRHIEDQSSEKIFSILKLANFFRQHFNEIITLQSDKKLIEQIKLHCTYDKRNDRDNATQFQFKLAA
jgi:Transposase DDE domain